MFIKMKKMPQNQRSCQDFFTFSSYLFVFFIFKIAVLAMSSDGLECERKRYGYDGLGTTRKLQSEIFAGFLSAQHAFHLSVSFESWMQLKSLESTREGIVPLGCRLQQLLYFNILCLITRNQDILD